MSKNYKKSIAIVLSFLFIIFGVLGAFAETQDTTKSANISEQPQTVTTESAPKKTTATESADQNEALQPPATQGRWARLLQFIVNAIILGIVGILLLIIGYYIWELITVNYSVKDELVENKNTAVAIVTASFVLGMAIVIGIALTKI